MTAHRKQIGEKQERVNTTVSISKRLLRVLDRIAYERNLSRCAVIRDALLRYVRADQITSRKDRRTPHRTHSERTGKQPDAGILPESR